MTLFYSKFRYLEPILAEIIYAGAGPESFLSEGGPNIKISFAIFFFAYIIIFYRGETNTLSWP